MITNPNKKLRVAGYGRVSTQVQVKDGTSADDQRMKIKKECERKGYILHNCYFDAGISGKSLKNRPDIQKLISDAKDGKFRMVMFTRLDRIARNLREMLNLWHLFQEELGLSIYSTDYPILNTDTIFGKMMLSFLGAFAEFERDLIRERTMRGKDIKLKNGDIFPGGSPLYGYRWDKKGKQIEIIPELQEVYLQIVSLYLDQHYTMKDIAKILTDRGVPTPSGTAKNWSSIKISQILKSPAYKGDTLVYNQFYYKQLKSDKTYSEPDRENPKPKEDRILIPYNSMIDKEKWRLIQERIEQQKLKPKKRHKQHENQFLVKEALGKSLRCGECDSTMTKRVRYYKEKPTFYYICSWKTCSKKDLDLAGRERCILKSVNSEYIDLEVYKSIVQLLSNPIHFGNQWLVEHDTTNLKKEIKNLNKKIETLKKKIRNGYEEIIAVDDPDTKKDYISFREQHIAERNKLKRKRDQMNSELESKSNAETKLKELQKYVKNNGNKYLSTIWKIPLFDNFYESEFKKFLMDLPFEEKKRIVEAVIAPEKSGKVDIRYPRLFDRINPPDFVPEDPTKPIEEEWDQCCKEPFTDAEPIVDMIFEIDVNRLESVITGLDKKGLLDKQDERCVSLSHIQIGHRE